MRDDVGTVKDRLHTTVRSVWSLMALRGFRDGVWSVSRSYHSGSQEALLIWGRSLAERCRGDRLSTLVTRLSAQARGGTRGVLWLNSHRRNLTPKPNPAGELSGSGLRAYARARHGSAGGGVGVVLRQWDTYAPKLSIHHGRRA